MAVIVYVGSSDRTGELELAKIERIVCRYHTEYVILHSLMATWGYRVKLTAQILIDDDEARVLETLERLRHELQQENVAYMLKEDLENFG